MKQAPVLSEKDLKAVLQSISKGKYARRNRLMIMLSHLTGMRVGEIASLNVSDVVTPNGDIRDQISLTKYQTKGSEACTIYLNKGSQQEISAYLYNSNLSQNDPLFLSSSKKKFSPNSLCQVFRRLYRSAGLDKATSHSGRRTFCTRLSQKAVSIRVLSTLMRHKNISTTQLYIDCNDDVLRQAIEMI